MRFQLAFRLASGNATFLGILHHSAGIIFSGMNAAPENLPELLAASSSGDASARDQLVSLVYDELRRLAQNYLRRERLDHTMQATALVHEAYLRLIGQTRVPARNQDHFPASDPHFLLPV